ncbi:uncharacterized protein [Lolium perenne]|uniref:uncharacterized protein n=1 Tax=Lolium perenne TaxID=4522 RepID=UPI003A996DF1
MEAYIGIRPTRETFARFFNLRINSVQGKEIPKPKPPVQCGSCIVGSRQGSTFLKLSGLESCRTWQGTFFYVKNTGRADRINLPPYQAGPPSRTNWSYNPRTEHAETNRVVRFLASLKKETNICSDDIIRTFISRRVLPLKRRAHRMSEMYGPGDPTKITGRALSKKDVVLKAKQICQTAMPFAWEWGLLPLSFSNRPTQEARDRFPSIQAEPRGPLRKRAFDSFDPDPYIFWKDLKMGKTPAARLGRDPPEPTGNPEELVVLEVTADTRKALFEELLWEHRELAEAHDKCQVIPEASIDALKEQLATAQREKDELSRQHQEELNALKTSYQELKSQLIQLGLDHAKALKAAEVTAAAKLDEALENACNATVVLRAELEEMTKARKGADEKAARLEEGHKDCSHSAQYFTCPIRPWQIPTVRFRVPFLLHDQPSLSLFPYT